MYGGESGIRTLGRLQTYNGFQDRRLQPLSHPTMFGMVRIIKAGFYFASKIHLNSKKK